MTAPRLPDAELHTSIKNAKSLPTYIRIVPMPRAQYIALLTELIELRAERAGLFEQIDRLNRPCKGCGE